jgi:hypothetical protein
MHLECEEAMNDLDYNDICDGWVWGEMERPGHPNEWQIAEMNAKGIKV